MHALDQQQTASNRLQYSCCPGVVQSVHAWVGLPLLITSLWVLFMTVMGVIHDSVRKITYSHHISAPLTACDACTRPPPSLQNLRRLPARSRKCHACTIPIIVHAPPPAPPSAPPPRPGPRPPLHLYCFLGGAVLLTCSSASCLSATDAGAPVHTYGRHAHGHTSIYGTIDMHCSTAPHPSTLTRMTGAHQSSRQVQARRHAPVSAH